MGCKLPAPVGCEVHQIIGEGREKGVAITIAQDDDDAPADSFRRRADAPSASLRVVAAAPALLVLAARAKDALDFYQYQLGAGC